jgi:redox-sensing transcriptional repressor
MENINCETKIISKQALQRLPNYLNYLKLLEKDNVEYVSAPTIANVFDLNEVKVRKDLAAVSESSGVPKKGFIVGDLINNIRNFLGYNNTSDAILIGAGQLGNALLSYKGFKAYGINIVAAFDNNDNKIGETIDGKNIFHISKLPNLCKRMKIKIAVITVPEDKAQDVCNLLIENNILAIWNFAPMHLKVPKDILVHNENMASSLAHLSNQLREKLKE